MRLQFDPLRNLIAENVSQAIATAFGVQPPQLAGPEAIYNLLSEPPDNKMGHLCLPVFNLAKALKNAPPKIAQEITAKIAASPAVNEDLNGAGAKPSGASGNSGGAPFMAAALGPYINFTFSGVALGEKILAPIHSGEFFKTQLTAQAPKTMIEYSQPNTHKELHVGHMRNLCLGDALVRLLQYANYEIITCTFPGDMGTHVAKCLWYLKNHNQEPQPKANKGEWLGRMYSRAHLKLEDEENSPKGAKNKDELTAIIKQLESKSGEYYKLWQETREWSVELMQSVYTWADVKFDVWYWESQVDAESVKLVERYYKEGKLVLSEGAIGMDLNAENLGFCLLLKSDGTGLYATKDVELARRKFEDYGVGKSVYNVDMRQALHFKQVFKVLEKVGFEQAKQCFHLQYNYVELPDGAMSSRKGNIVPLTELIHRMEETVKTDYLARYKGEWPEQEVQHVAEIVAKGAIKYGMVRQDSNKKIVFDMNEWLKLDGESGPFIQYSYARIASLIRKQGFNTETSVQWSELKHPAELTLAAHMAQFNLQIVNAAENYKPAALCNYLYDVARNFNVFYHECPIGSAETEALKVARMSLAAAAGLVLKQGLALLGIPVPERM